jgi:raffinose/stachyose/melibiose transport system substrate-binding protein
MDLMGQWAPYTMASEATNKKGLGDDLGWMPFPLVEGGAGKPTDVMGGGNGYIIGKNAPPETVEFLKYITSLKNNSLLAGEGRITPVVIGADKALKDPNQIAIAKAASKADYYQLYYDQYLPPAVGEVVKDAVQTLFAGTKSPQEAAQMIDDSFVANKK